MSATAESLVLPPSNLQVIAAVRELIELRPGLLRSSFPTLPAYWKVQRELARDRRDAERMLRYLQAERIATGQQFQAVLAQHGLNVRGEAPMVIIPRPTLPHLGTRAAVCRALAALIHMHKVAPFPEKQDAQLKMLGRRLGSHTLIKRWF